MQPTPCSLLPARCSPLIAPRSPLIAPRLQSKPGTITKTSTETRLDTPWNVIVHDDPVNLMGYVTWVLKKVFGYPEQKASELMMRVHQSGRAVVWTGQRERAEFYVHQLHAHQLKSTLEKAS